MKLKKYDFFAAFKLFESILEMDGDLIGLVQSIMNSSSVAKELIRIFDSRKDLKLNQNYLSKADVNDEVRFMNDSQGKRLKDGGQNPFDSKTAAKIGRVVRQILVADNITPVDAEIEKFVNLYKAAWNKRFNKSDDRMRLIKGEDIRFWYSHVNYNKGGGTLNNSCMRYDHTQKFLDIYVNNPEVCQLLIYVDTNNDLIGRALLWTLDEEVNGNKYFLDRMYSTHDHQVQEMWQFALSKFGNNLNAHIRGLSIGTFKVRLRKWRSSYYPYMDSLYYMTATQLENTPDVEGRKWGDAIITNSNGGGGRQIPLFRMRATSGMLEHQNHWVYSRKFKTPYYDGESISLEEMDVDVQGRPARVADYIPKYTLANCDGEGVWAPKDQAEYSDLYKKTYRKISLIDSEWGKIPINCLVSIFDFNKIGGLKEVKKIPKILLERPSEYDQDYVYCDVGRDRYYVKKDKCIPPFRAGNRYTVSGNNSYLYLVKIDLSEMISKDNSSGFIEDPNLFDSGIAVKQVSTHYLGSQISTVYIKMKHGEYPIGAAYDNNYYCLSDVANTFKFKIIEGPEHWVSKSDYFTWVYSKMVFKEVKEFNDRVNPELNRICSDADRYLMGQSSDYVRKQKSFEISGYPGGFEAWMVDVYFRKFINSTSNKSGGLYYDFLLNQLINVRSWFDAGSGYSFKGVDTRQKPSDWWIKLVNENIKAITFINMLCPIFANENVQNYFKNNIVFFDKECGIGRDGYVYNSADANTLRLFNYTEVSNNYARHFVRELYNIDGDFIYRELRVGSSSDNPSQTKVAKIFNLLWEKLEPLVMSRVKEKEEVLKNPPTTGRIEISNLTYEDILGCDGCDVEYNIDGDKGTGKITIEVYDGSARIFICQNRHGGTSCKDKKGFSSSWILLGPGESGVDRYENRIVAIHKPSR